MTCVGRAYCAMCARASLFISENHQCSAFVHPIAVVLIFLTKMSSDLLTTFEPNDGSYNTEPVIAGSVNDNNSINSGPARDAMRPRRDKTTTNLLDALIVGCKNNRLISLIMGATLLASVSNTILLSFVIKSLQINDVSTGQ